METVVSGIRSTGKLHLGNYYGALRNFIRMQEEYDCYFFVADWHSLTTHPQANLLHENVKNVFVEYYDCTDNHSRIEPNKKEAQELETLSRIIPWYLKERLVNNKNFNLNSNEFGEDLITFESMGYKFIGVHGDKDPIKNIDHLSMMTEQHYDMLLTAHLHHMTLEEKNRTVAIGNGTLMGTDSYAQKLRLSSTPSQNLIIISEENVTDGIYRIVS